MLFKLKFSVGSLFTLLFCFLGFNSLSAQDFQGKAYYMSKSTLELGRWGARFNEAQKKQIKERLKNRLEKTYVLKFNIEESRFTEEDKLDAISGATDSWGKNFSPGPVYKNVKQKTLVQEQEFYGKRFLIKDKLINIEWNMTNESKKIGDYMCMKAVGVVPSDSLTWYDFSWNKLRNSNANEDNAEDINLTQIEAWYTPQIPVSHGPYEYWGLPGLILEVSIDKTTILCYKLILNGDKNKEIEVPNRGEKVKKAEYQNIIMTKMGEMRDMYRRGR